MYTHYLSLWVPADTYIIARRPWERSLRCMVECFPTFYYNNNYYVWLCMFLQFKTSLYIQWGTNTRGSVVCMACVRIMAINISHRCQQTVKHYRIMWDGKHFSFGLGKFPDIASLKQHFDNQPIISGDSGTLLSQLWWIRGIHFRSIMCFY